MDSTVLTIRIKDSYLKRIDSLIKTRLYKDRPHFIELAIIRELGKNELDQ